MLINTEPQVFKHYFPSDPHPFISNLFIELNRHKADSIIRLIEGVEKPSIGLVAGIKNNRIVSPFSAPFGGFHFKNEVAYISELEKFIELLKEYIIAEGLSGIDIILPPDIYHQTFNAKMVSALIRGHFHSQLPDLTNWIDLDKFKGIFSQKNTREYYKQALKNHLIFKQVNDKNELKAVYELIRENRARFDRPIYMTLEDIQNTGTLWPVDFFKVTSEKEDIVASAIFYRFHPQICYAVFWGDNEGGRPLRAMDFLVYNLISHYKDSGFKYMDLGISTETGIPNEGLLRFKESHEAFTSLKYKFSWNQ